MPVGGNHGRKPPNPHTVPKQHGRKPPMGRPQHGRKPAPPPPRTGKSKSDGCCPMAAAVRSARRGKFRLARRYAAMSVRLIAARVA